MVHYGCLQSQLREIRYKVTASFKLKYTCEKSKTKKNKQKHPDLKTLQTDLFNWINFFSVLFFFYSTCQNERNIKPHKSLDEPNGTLNNKLISSPPPHPLSLYLSELLKYFFLLLFPFSYSISLTAIWELHRSAQLGTHFNLCPTAQSTPVLLALTGEIDHERSGKYCKNIFFVLSN